MAQDEANDFLMGSSIKSCDFPVIGHWWKGTIISEPTVAEQRDLKGNLKTWDNGDPQKMLVITLQTEVRDPAVDNDNGQRRLYVKGSKKPESKTMTSALAQAVKASGATGIAIGGEITMQYTGDGVSQGPGYDAPKQYEAWYVPPSVGATAAFLGNTEVAAPPGVAAAPPVAAPPAVQAPPATAPPVAAPPAVAQPPLIPAQPVQQVAAGVAPGEQPAQFVQRLLASGLTVEQVAQVQGHGLDINTIQAIAALA